MRSEVLNESGYRLMWMMVMFDLPVVDDEDRKKATKFRNFLLDSGFEMSQFSVYFRFCGNKEKGETFVRQIKRSTPATGKVSILFFTDKQFSDIVNIQNREILEPVEKLEQMLLF